MIAYHGTIVGGLHVLMPFENPQSSLGYACVYLSTNKVLASIYIWDKEYKLMTFGIGNDGKPVYTEFFKDSLLEFYSGVKGYIYKCDAEFYSDESTNISCAVISRDPVYIQDVDVVNDAYERILQYEQQGLLVINRYNTLSEEQKKRHKRLIIDTINKYDLLKYEHPLSSVISKKFPEIWEEAIRDR